MSFLVSLPLLVLMSLLDLSIRLFPLPNLLSSPFATLLRFSLFATFPSLSFPVFNFSDNTHTEAAAEYEEAAAEYEDVPVEEEPEPLSRRAAWLDRCITQGQIQHQVKHDRLIRV